MNRRDRFEEYRHKRDFDATDEPRGEGEQAGGGFVIQHHAASADHYGFRLEVGGGRGPGRSRRGRRPIRARSASVPTEDHPVEYASFEGVIEA